MGWPPSVAKGAVDSKSQPAGGTAPTREAARDPKVGAAVHVIGHGPGVLLHVGSKKNWGGRRYKVQYPNGTCYHVSRRDILMHAPPSETKRLPVHSSPRQGVQRLVYLGKAFDDVERRGSLPSATFSLVATMIGGGVLSLPYAMSKCGLVFGTLSMLSAAFASAWTLDMLVECARRTGRDTFELLGHAAFGEVGRRVTMALVFVFCWLTMVAYFVLLADLLVPLVTLAAPSFLTDENRQGMRKVIVAVGALLLSPMCFKKSLTALRFLCFGSVGSVLFVATVILARAAPTLGQAHEVNVVFPDTHEESVLVPAALALWPTDWLQALYVFPMFGVSFLCHFNALPTHQELRAPTKARIRRVFGCTMALTSLLYLVVGVSGYVYGSSHTCGNILLNFRRTDSLITVSRGALASVLMLNFPLICQPCRNALFRLLALVRAKPPAAEDLGTSLQAAAQPPDASLQRSVVHVYRHEEVRRDRSESAASLHAFDEFEPKDEIVQSSAGEASTLQRCLLTAALLSSALSISLFMRNVMVVWSILGSSVCFCLGFILPCAFWAEIVGPTASSFRRRASKGLLILSVITAASCTAVTCFNLNNPSCPLDAVFA